MTEMAVEMERMGLIEEVMGEALDSLDVLFLLFHPAVFLHISSFILF